MTVPLVPVWGCVHAPRFAVIDRVEQATGNQTNRQKLSRELQVKVFRRDGWICRWCGRPVIFAPAMKHLKRFVRDCGINRPLAYHDGHWTRRNAPLLDHLGAVIDHVDAHSLGGANALENLATACNKCNANKSNLRRDDFTRDARRRPVKGRYGEPQDWDGLSTLFVVLAEQNPEALTASERDWLKYLRLPTDSL
jgi:5-methylcytosine-specific restriction endonuclease McrA